MKDLNLMADLAQSIKMCVICSSFENSLTKIEPCDHNICLFCLDQWLRNHKKCPECHQYISYIYLGERKININEWIDIKLNIFNITKSQIERKVLVRKILEERNEMITMNFDLNQELLDPHLPDQQKNAIKKQIVNNYMDARALFEIALRNNEYENNELLEKISDDEDIDGSIELTFDFFIQQCYVLGKTDINSICMYIIQSIDDYLNNIVNHILMPI